MHRSLDIWCCDDCNLKYCVLKMHRKRHDIVMQHKCAAAAAGVHIYHTDPEPQPQQPGTRLGVMRGKAAAVFDSSFGAVQLQGRARKDEHLKIHHHMVSCSSSAFLCHAATVARSHDSITDEIFFTDAGGELEKRNTQYSNHIHIHSHCHCYLGN